MVDRPDPTRVTYGPWGTGSKPIERKGCLYNGGVVIGYVLVLLAAVVICRVAWLAFFLLWGWLW